VEFAIDIALLENPKQDDIAIIKGIAVHVRYLSSLLFLLKVTIIITGVFVAETNSGQGQEIRNLDKNL
jgi:hypothetical protein